MTSQPGSSPTERDLGTFRGAGYDKGRPILVQAAWFAVQNALFSAWWCPARIRPVLLRLFGARIGDRVFIRHRVRVLWPWKLTIGNDVWIGEGAWLLNLEHITIEDDVCVSQEALICTGSHDHRDLSFEFDNAPITLRHGAWVAARAIILRGADVPRGTLVPAGSVFRRPTLSEGHIR